MRLCEFWRFLRLGTGAESAAPAATPSPATDPWKARPVLAAALIAGQILAPSWSLAQNSQSDGLGPVRLGTSNTETRGNEDNTERPTTQRPARRNVTEDNQRDERRRSETERETVLPRDRSPVGSYLSSEFERYAQRAAGEPETGAPIIRRFGAELLQAATPMLTQESGNQIPQDYVIGIGDEVLVTLWGSVEADLKLTVDRSGRISLPRIGPVMVAGLRYGELGSAIDQRVSHVFKNYKLSASLGRLRSIRVYVTGATKRPGAYTVSSLSTLVNALMQAGGPSVAGSFRNIELRRSGKLVSNFDFYALLLKGDKTADKSLQSEDVIHIGSVGPQVALIGSVNTPAIFELRPNETVDDLLAMAGGFTAVADRSRVTVERLDARNDLRISDLNLPASGTLQPRSGDLYRAYSAVEMTLPQHKQNKRVRVEGEVLRPGEFIMPANSTLADAIRAAGGLTPGAYIFGTEFNRESVRLSQQDNYERALRDLETEFTRSTTTQRALSADEATAQATRSQGSTKLIERLRAVRPTGRIVLQLTPNASTLPELALEDGDRLLIPPRPTTVGVFGSVFNGGSYLFATGGSVNEFLRLAGGPTRGADTNSIFVLRANGSVVSARQRSSGWILAGGDKLEAIPAEPGDTIFVPEELNKTSFVQEAKEWTQILYQFGIGAAALKTIKN